jgi:hypothetical protein
MQVTQEDGALAETPRRRVGLAVMVNAVARGATGNGSVTND